MINLHNYITIKKTKITSMQQTSTKYMLKYVKVKHKNKTVKRR